MTTMNGGRVLAGAVGVLMLAAAAVSSRPVELATTITSSRPRPAAGNEQLSVYFHADSCPQLETIVRSTVDAAVQQNVRLTAGLLRIFFHDCFPQGCDASILLDNGERGLPPNVGIQQEAVQLVEDIRGKVHAACGPTVSCADITVLATRDAVSLAGGPSFTVPLGRLDSKAPASSNDVFTLPPPTSTVDELLSAFASKNLTDPADLVALSAGAHTVGKARCSSFGDVSGVPATDDIARCVTATCSAPGSANTLRDLDFLTPVAFDNVYFVELMLKKNKGVMLPSDQGLATDSRTSWLVQGFADNHWWFFDQFKTSMVKMSQLRGPQGNVGEIRRNCFRPNTNAVAAGIAASA